jgi:hydrogenase maturation protease
VGAFFQILVYGYGNPGREDDGLGIELVKRLEAWSEHEGIEGISYDSNYQLNIEDAEIISGKDVVIFADASTEDIEDFIITEVKGDRDVSFTTHAASPGYIVKLCSELFGRCPETYLVHVKGYQWDFKEGISEKALENLERAYTYLTEFILNLYDQKSKINFKP